ncbi:hypothetical protein T11_14371 [Trichinella zimbabwensis]|uniref:Uncharacterized protein n=1 Tax=Trichinella zimbabwensis TaxID=268475 RepID=A0A0V1DNV7_9BILA|nr:hypothetical protein T11_10407 [Trichinella zimbabwensis]KRY72507.1 hypothetical protein T11_14371 [Trichinella zimbabwensis]
MAIVICIVQRWKPVLGNALLNSTNEDYLKEKTNEVDI